VNFTLHSLLNFQSTWWY